MSGRLIEGRASGATLEGKRVPLRSRQRRDPRPNLPELDLNGPPDYS